MSQKILEQKMSESQKSVARVQEAMAKVNSKFEQAAQSETGIDIESADLAAVHAHTDTMNANIAELIMGLDDITNSFSNDFNEMRNKTGMEKFVGIFALYLDERGPVSVADTSASSPRSVTQRRNGVMLWQTVQSLLVTPAVFRASVNPPQTSLFRKR